MLRAHKNKNKTYLVKIIKGWCWNFVFQNFIPSYSQFYSQLLQLQRFLFLRRIWPQVPRASEWRLPGSLPWAKLSESSWYVSWSRMRALAAPFSSSSSGKYCLCTDMLEMNPAWTQQKTSHCCVCKQNRLGSMIDLTVVQMWAWAGFNLDWMLWLVHTDGCRKMEKRF